MATDTAALDVLRCDVDRGHTLVDDAEVRSRYQLQVHKATSMVKVQLVVTTEAAFVMLRARAFAAGRALVDVANDVVARRRHFSGEDP
ncbi:MAG: hypothetical protein ACYDAQ_07080 [Mycobacteriales bacterium]